MLLKISLFLTCIICAAEANPDKPDCNLLGTSGTNNGANVMTLTSIMGATPTDATNLITFDTSTYNQGDAKITVTLANLQSGGAVIHTSAGTLSSAENTQTTPSGYTAKTSCTTRMFYKQNSVGATLTLYLTVPSDITSVSSITVSVLTASGQSTVSRQALSLTNTVTTTTSTAAPTTTTTQGPTTTTTQAPTTTTGPTTTTTQGPTPSPGPTTTTSAASSTTQGPTSAAASTSTSSMSTDTTTEAEIDIAARATSSLVLFILPLLTLFYISC